MSTLTIAALTGVAGAAILITVILQLLFHTAALSAAAQDRWGPAFAVGLGIVIVVAATWLTTSPIVDAANLLAQAVMTGLFAGLAAVGGHSVAIQTLKGSPSPGGAAPGTPPAP